MPVMNGWQFCSAKQADPCLASIPVVALSAAAKTDPESPYFIDVHDVAPSRSSSSSYCPSSGGCSRPCGEA